LLWPVGIIDRDQGEPAHLSSGEQLCHVPHRETLRVLFFMTLAILVFNFYPVTAVMIVMIGCSTTEPFFRSRMTTFTTRNKPKHGTCGWCWPFYRAGVIGVVAAFGLFYLAEPSSTSDVCMPRH